MCMSDDDIKGVITLMIVLLFVGFVMGYCLRGISYQKDAIKIGVAEYYQVSPDSTDMKFRYKAIQSKQIITNNVYILTNNLTIIEKIW
jgi:hypothetical protein